MSDRLAELLKLASNDSGETSNDNPPGVRVGDICSNGWASNRNPNKLFMYLGMTGDSFRGINIEGKSAGPVLKGNAVKIVLPRDTPDYWRKWELLAKQLPLLCLAILCLSGCLTAAKIGEWQRAVYGWGMDQGASKPCQLASAKASAYLAKSDTDLLSTGKLTDLSSDSRARELVTSAALACGEEAPMLHMAYTAGQHQAIARTWTDERPTEPGEYWVSLKPSSRGGILPTKGYPLAVTMFLHSGDPCVGINGVAFGLETRSFDGAKWSRRETPADPFQEVAK